MSEDEKAEFRYRVLAPLNDPDKQSMSMAKRIRELARKTYDLGRGRQVKFSPETIKKWRRKYKKYGLAGLRTRHRTDRGQSRKASPEVIKKACDLKLEVPGRTLKGVIRILEREKIIKPGILKKSSLHRIFQSRGLVYREPKRDKGYWQRFQAEHPNDMWQSDMLYGPHLPDPKSPGRQRKTYLFAWIDDHSRVILHGQFFFDGKLPHLEHCLRKGIQKFGIPRKIYVDNGTVYISDQLAIACGHLGIHLIHTKPYSPQGKGKIERFFGTVRRSFLVEFPKSQILTLENLNKAFLAWLDLDYHSQVHSSLEKTPFDAFFAHKDKTRDAPEELLKEAFLYREKRKVHKDCTFQLFGRTYEVMAALVKREIEVRYDPEDLESVKVYLAGEFFQIAKPLILRPHVRKHPDPGTRPIDSGTDYLQRLIEEHKNHKEADLFGPSILTPSDDRLTLKDLLKVLVRDSRPLAGYEKRELMKYFDTYGPFPKQKSLTFLEKLVSLKGSRQHFSFYLDSLIDHLRKPNGGHS